MNFLMVKLVLDSSCHMGTGSIAYDLAGVSDYMADINFMELFGTPAHMFLVNY